MQAQADLAVHGSLPAASPDGRWIAFLSDRDGALDVYVMRANGTGVRRLTRSADPAGALSWSGDSRHIRFAIEAGPTWELHAVPVGGGPARLVTRIAGRAPLLSPDGTAVAYTVGQWPRTILMVSRPDGRMARAISDSSAAAFDPAWSPDGGWIAFTRRTADSAGLMSIWVAKADGTDRRRVDNIPDGVKRQWPAWSPDGRRIAFQASGDPAAGTGAHIWVVDLGSTAARRLAPHTEPYLDETPGWLGNGALVFQTTRTGRLEIWTMGADGTGGHAVERK